MAGDFSHLAGGDLEIFLFLQRRGQRFGVGVHVVRGVQRTALVLASRSCQLTSCARMRSVLRSVPAGGVIPKPWKRSTYGEPIATPEGWLAAGGSAKAGASGQTKVATIHQYRHFVFMEVAL